MRPLAHAEFSERGSRKFENTEDKKKGFHSELVRFFGPNLDEDQKKKIFTHMQPVFLHRFSAQIPKRGEAMTQFCALFLLIYSILEP